MSEWWRKQSAGQASSEQRRLSVSPALVAANLTKQKPTRMNYDDRLDVIIFFFIDRYLPENTIQ